MFHYFRVPKTIMNKRGVARFSVESFCLTVPKFFVGEPFFASLLSGTEEVWIGGGGEVMGYDDFPSKIFCRTLPKISLGGIL